MAVNDALFMSRLNVFDVDVDPLLIPMKTDELTQLEEFLNAPTSLSSSASSLELSLAASSVMPSPYEPSMGRYGSSSSAPDDSTMASLATSPDVHLSLLHHSPAHMESVVAAFLKDQRVVSALQTQNEATYGSSSTSPCGSEPSDFISRLLDPLGSCVSTDDVDTPTSTTKRYPVELPPTQDEDDDLDDDFVSKLKGTRGKKRAKLMETLSDEDRLR